jgi:sugar phosphate isomerase/epimerase
MNGTGVFPPSRFRLALRRRRAPGQSILMKYAICNEIFESWSHPEICRFIAEVGYTGLEIAPFTLAPRITDVTAEQRRQLRQEAADLGIEIIGLHWLLAKTEGFHLTSTDVSVRKRTAEYLKELARACADMGGKVLVFGSPLQRNLLHGISTEDGMNYAAETFHLILPTLQKCDVCLCLEPLGPVETNFLNTCAEAMTLIGMIDHPNFRLHLDVKAMSSEATPVPDLIRKYAPHARHFHANDTNKRGPGFGDTDFQPIFQALGEKKYPYWVSVEVFDFTPDPQTIARESIRYMRECESSSPRPGTPGRGVGVRG